MTGKIKRLFLAVVAISVFTALPLPGQAATITFSAVNGLGTADFTMGPGTLNILLTDTAVNPVSVGSNLAGVLFQLTNGASSWTFSSAGTINPTSPEYVVVNQDHTYSIVSGAAVWGYGASGSTNALTWNNNSTYGITGTTGPRYSIIGLPDSISGKYDNANASILNNPSPNNTVYLSFRRIRFCRARGHHCQHNNFRCRFLLQYRLGTSPFYGSGSERHVAPRIRPRGIGRLETQEPVQIDNTLPGNSTGGRPKGLPSRFFSPQRLERFSYPCRKFFQSIFNIWIL